MLTVPALQAAALRGKIFMKSVAPDNTGRLPLRSSPQRIGILVIRFIGLLLVAVVALGLAWSR